MEKIMKLNKRMETLIAKTRTIQIAASSTKGSLISKSAIIGSVKTNMMVTSMTESTKDSPMK
ncbi:hypothetical protein SDC9_157190 [bioreactor metagenome]|uniref:Uncharacterized protein n=1 Tax=bioreactor metagenome TaxID=1076179 RepID=A0A645F6S7_9ZZZZ